MPMIHKPTTLITVVFLCAPLLSGGRATAATPAPSAAGTIQHTRHVGHRHHTSATAASRPPNVAPAVDKATAGTQPAPIPNENVPDVPPGQAPDTQVTPSLLQLHYPHVGDGYVQGSSPSAIDDRNTAKAPGVEMQMPLK